LHLKTYPAGDEKMENLNLPSHAGVTAVGLKVGLVLPHDDIALITADAVKEIVEDGDIICVTEAVVARSQNRYISCEEIAEDISQKLELKKGGTVAVINPIASRNRFALILKAIAMATEGGKVIVQFPIPFDEVGNEVIEEEFASIRLNLKKTLRSLLEARGNTPMLNVLIREIIAALKLQELGYQIISIRKITGKGIADLTVKTPQGKIAVIEVTFDDLLKAAQKAVNIQKDVQEAEIALAVGVDLGHCRLSLVDAAGYLKSGAQVQEFDFNEQFMSYQEPEVIFLDELGNNTFMHPITGLDYRKLYLQMIAEGGAKGEVIFTNNPLKVYDRGYIDGVCIGAIHKRKQLEELFLSFGAKVPVIDITGIGPGPWGLIGSNASDFDKGILKLLPEDSDRAAEKIKERIFEVSGKKTEVLIFGDGAYKDPDTWIYELADPHPAIGVSSGLKSAGLRTGVKLKLIVDTLYRQGYSREEISSQIESKTNELLSENLGTTPRSITSIIGTIADLIAGSADAGTPVVLIRGFKY